MSTINMELLFYVFKRIRYIHEIIVVLWLICLQLICSYLQIRSFCKHLVAKNHLHTFSLRTIAVCVLQAKPIHTLILYVTEA